MQWEVLPSTGMESAFFLNTPFSHVRFVQIHMEIRMDTVISLGGGSPFFERSSGWRKELAHQDPLAHKLGYTDYCHRLVPVCSLAGAEKWDLTG